MLVRSHRGCIASNECSWYVEVVEERGGAFARKLELNLNRVVS